MTPHTSVRLIVLIHLLLSSSTLKNLRREKNTVILHLVPSNIVCFDKNRTYQLQRRLNWAPHVSLRSYNSARGDLKTVQEKKSGVDVLLRSVVRDAPVQGDAVTELSVVAVLLIFPLGVTTVLSESRSSPALSKASGSFD